MRHRCTDRIVSVSFTTIDTAATKKVSGVKTAVPSVFRKSLDNIHEEAFHGLYD